MRWVEKIVNCIILTILKLLCRIDRKDLSLLPKEGPYIIIVNHINFLEVPLLYLMFLPRRIRAFVKEETLSHPTWKYLVKLWKGIPIKRGTADSTAMREGLDTLRKGMILVLAPEGTRSGNGHLQKGFAGVVPLAVRGDVPIYPVAHFGGENLYKNIRAFRKTPVRIKVGQPFRIELGEQRPTQRIRQEIMDQIMCRLADLLPPGLHGYYSGMSSNDTFLAGL